MKVKHYLLAGSAFALLTLAACKKDDKEDENQTPEKTTAEKIQAKWNLDGFRYHEFYEGEDADTTLPVLTTDYFEFRKDSMYARFYGEQDTLAYNILNDSTLLIKGLGLYNDDGTYKIRDLSDTKMTLYTREADPDNSANYDEVWFNLKK